LLAQLVIDNKNGELLPGAYAEVQFQAAPRKRAQSPTSCPANVLLFRSDGLHVGTVDAKETASCLKPVGGRPATTAPIVEIVRGLDTNDKVILSPPDSLSDGPYRTRSHSCEARSSGEVVSPNLPCRDVLRLGREAC